MNDEKRVFVAVPLPPDIKQMLHAWCERQRGEYPFRKWVYEEDFHVTLQFLGDCGAERLQRVKEELTRKIAQAPFELRLSGIGTFGRREQPRILWAGVQGDLEALHKLQAEVVKAMHTLDFPAEDRPYRPHVTLSRNYQGTAFPYEELAAAWQQLQVPSWRVETIHLYRTDLGNKPMYATEHVVQLSSH